MPSAITIDDRDVLLAIDLQADFMPGGALAVDEGDSIVAAVNALMRRFAHVVVTQDWHPRGHASFASTHGVEPFATKRLHYGDQTLWPDHCVQGTAGAALHPELETDSAFLILRKGMHADLNSYSAFVEADGRTTTGLAALLRARGVRRVFAAGLRLTIASPFPPSMRARRVRNLRHRGCLPSDRRQRFARRRLGQDERREGPAHPVAGNPRLSRPLTPGPPASRLTAG